MSRVTIAGMFAVTGPVTFAARQSASVGTSASSTSSQSRSHYADLATIHRRVSELGRALEDANSIFESLRMGGQVSASGGEAISSTALGIDPSARASTLDSTEEVNTVPTSYTPFGPSWTGASSSLVTIGGEYDGSSGDDTLRFRVTSRTRTIGGGRSMNVRVYDSGGTSRLEDISIPGSDPPDSTYTLSNGLEVSFGAGNLRRNDEFYLDVYTTIDSEVDPDLAFNGTRNDNPALEPGLPVTAGSFYVNGEEITVAADDTVNTVLDNINASAAGVTAIYDPSTELVSFEHDTPGENDIVLSGDTSGFLDSMKLTGATVVLGSETGEQDVVMQDVAALSGTAAGSLTINDVDIAIDPSTDSLNDVLGAINASDAGVTASFDDSTLKVTLAAEGSGGSVTLVDGGTNFSTAVAIDEGTYEGSSSTQRLSKIMARKAQRAMANVAEAFERLQATEVSDSRAQNVLDATISSIESAMTSALGDSEDTLSDAGLGFDLDASDIDDLVDMNGTLFERALRSSDGANLRSAMVGSMTDDEDGLLGLMNAAVEQAESALHRSTGSVALYLSTYA